MKLGASTACVEKIRRDWGKYYARVLRQKLIEPKDSGEDGLKCSAADKGIDRREERECYPLHKGGPKRIGKKGGGGSPNWRRLGAIVSAWVGFPEEVNPQKKGRLVTIARDKKSGSAGGP